MSSIVSSEVRVGAAGRIVRSTILFFLTLVLTTIAVWSQDLGQVGEAPPVTLTGGVNTRASFSESTREGSNSNPLSAILSGSLSVKVYGLNLPFSFAVSTEEQSFSQPFNQFGLSPKYKWITAHLGHRNLTHSPWTLSGHQMFGAGLELTPGPVRVSFIAGRLRNLVAADSTDSLRDLRVEFERSGYAGLIGYKGEAFEVELSGLMASDDTTGAEAAQILATGARPAENLVGAVSIAFRPVQGVRLKVSGGVSEYTRDVRSDTIALGEGFAALGELQQPRLSTQIYTGLKAEASINVGLFGLQTGYTRIDPDFQSMGAYYSSADVEAVNVAPSISLANRKLRIAGDLLLSHDNVGGKKVATTSTLAPSLQIDWSPSTAFGISLNGGTRVLSQKAGTLPLSDSMLINNQTPSLSIVPRYSITDTATVHSFSLVATHQRLLDENPVSSPFTEYSTTTGSLAYSFTRVQSGLSLNSSLSVNTIENSNGSQETLGGSLGGSYPLIREKLSLDASLGASFAEGGNTLGGSVGLAFRDGKHHTISLNLSANNAQSRATDLTEQLSTTAYRGVASYGYRF